MPLVWLANDLPLVVFVGVLDLLDLLDELELIGEFDLRTRLPLPFELVDNQRWSLKMHPPKKGEQIVLKREQTSQAFAYL